VSRRCPQSAVFDGRHPTDASKAASNPLNAVAYGVSEYRIESGARRLVLQSTTYDPTWKQMRGTSVAVERQF
jgi:hypothetical protein